MWPRWRGPVGRVGRDRSPFNGAVERRVHHGVASAHRRWRQSSGEQPGIEVVEVAAGQLVDSQGADCWPDVVVDGASVLLHRVPGAQGSNVVEPAVQQLRYATGVPCRELSLLHFDDELRQLPLGRPFAAVDGPRRVPAPTTLPASEDTYPPHGIPTPFDLTLHSLSLADSLPKVSHGALERWYINGSHR